jgi:hypothetical protein
MLAGHSMLCPYKDLPNGQGAAWIGPRASFRVVPLRCVESDTSWILKDGPLANAALHQLKGSRLHEEIAGRNSVDCL